MARKSVFQTNVDKYEGWFEANRWIYIAELRAVGMLVPEHGRGLEIGVGTGRFAAPLSIANGLEPSVEMGKVAMSRGITVIRGVAEDLPFRRASFDYIVMVTTICFLTDFFRAMEEVARVLTGNGYCIVALIDKNSPLGRTYEKNRAKSTFYRDATFYSVETVRAVMGEVGLGDFQCTQTLFGEMSNITAKEPVEPGCGKGSFVVIRGRKGNGSP